MAFLQKVKSKGRYYIYLREYQAMMGYADDKITIYRFGNINNCLEKMYAWVNSEKDLPHELKIRDIGKKEIYKWIREIEILSDVKKII